MRRTLLCLLGLAAALAAEDGWRDPLTDATPWVAQPTWLSTAAHQPVAETGADGLHFAIREPGRAMKWRRDVEAPELDVTPWLVFRYRASGYQAGTVDYVLWLGDSTPGGEGHKLIQGKDLLVDGRWHTLAIDLSALALTPPLQALALQCAAGADGRADLWVSQLALTDTPPPGTTPPAPPAGRTWPIEPGPAAAWTLQPDWLANPSPQDSCVANPAGPEFRVPQAGCGGKWSRTLPEPLRGARFVALRYRARRLTAVHDYALYLASEPGGKAAEEQYCIFLNDLIADDDWHVKIAPVQVPSIRTLAVQVQAGQADAGLIIGGLTFHETRPPVRLADCCDVTAGWAAAATGYRSVSLPPGNTAGLDLARKLRVDGWIPDGPVTSAGVPFTVRAGADAVNLTPLAEPGRIEVPLDGRAAELYLLLAAQLPATEEPSSGGGPAGGISQVDRLVARLEYADGTVDEQFPHAVRDGQPRVSAGLRAYALAVFPDRDLRRLTLLDGMRRGAFGLVALTAADQPGPASRATAPQAAVPVPHLPTTPGPAPAVGVDERAITITAGSATLTLERSPALQVRQLVSHAPGGAALRAAGGGLLSAEVDHQVLAAADFRVVSAERTADKLPTVRVELLADRVAPPVKVTVTLTAEGDEIGFQATPDFGRRDRNGCRLTFPDLSGLSVGEDTWYWLPRAGDALSNTDTRLREPYSGRAPLQVCGAFSPAAGTGLYLLTQDLTATPRYQVVEKFAGAVRLALDWTPCDAGPLPKVLLGGHGGDWHTAFDRYRRWVATWYRPQAPRKPWFREVFNFRQQFLHYGVPQPSGMFDAKTKTWHLAEVLARDAEAFGGCDYLHLFDWGYDPVHGRCGDYVPWDFLGGAAGFRQAVAAVQQAGTPVGLYLEGYLLDPPATVTREHGAAWQLLDDHLAPYPYFKPSLNACAAVPDWQDYLAATYGRVRRETGAVGYYVDEYGFANPQHACFNPAHQHRRGAWPEAGEREMLRKIRTAVGPDAAIYTEESPTDVNSQYQDGSFTYHIANTNEALSPSRVNLYRFALPDFKTIEIIVCDQPLGSNVQAVKQVLFNGEAIWLEGLPGRWFSPEVRAQIAASHRVLRANRTCFAGNQPTPLVPTLQAGLYANRFAERADERGKTCWTLSNTRYRTMRGELLAVRHFAGARYVDELTGRPLTVRVDGDHDVLAATLGPRDVTVISRTTR